MEDGKTEGVERRQRREEEGRYTLARSKRAWADTKTACHPSCPHTPSRSPQLPFLAAFSPSSLLLRPVSPPPPLEPSHPTRPHARPASRVSALFSVANPARSAPARGGSAKGSRSCGEREAPIGRGGISAVQSYRADLGPHSRACPPSSASRATRARLVRPSRSFALSSPSDHRFRLPLPRSP